MSIFLAVSLGIVTATLFGFFARAFKQPVLIGYLFAGIVLSVFGAYSSEHKTVLESMSNLGITLLLFLLGLEMNLKELPSVGRVAVLSGLGQILFTSVVGYAIATLLGFDTVSSLYIAIALTFSSTIIIVKLLSEKRDLTSLYGKISIGFLLVKDFVAVLVLMLLSGFQTEVITEFTFFWILIKGFLILGVMYVLANTVLVKIFDKLAQSSQELLFMASIAWALLVASVISSPQLGFSIEIGGFLAGLALSTTSEHLQIASRVRPLRDFFVTIVFLMLGAKLVAGITPDIILPSIILSLVVLIGSPIIIMSIMGLLGHKKRTSFFAAVTVAQISEFSFILVTLGQKAGHIENQIVTLVTLVGVITMTVSTYMILYSQNAYERFKKVLGIFERKLTHESAFTIEEDFSGHVVLVGADRTGKSLIPVLKKRDEKLVVVDFNPAVINRMQSEGITSLYGDVSDSDLLDILKLEKARLLISTINNPEDNIILMNRIKKAERRVPAVFVVGTPMDALKLYDAGADYVVVPRIVSGEHLAHAISNHGIDRDYFKKLKNREFDRMAKERY